ncbi:MAG: fumarylacetoacetate hydrolase family protein [Firmicutes bacterium]|nr:fumarylacetoacetate hydrolase family protein [Bacillota bacterium]
MKFVSFQRKPDGVPSYGFLTPTGIVSVPALLESTGYGLNTPQTLVEFIETHEVWMPRLQEVFHTHGKGFSDRVMALSAVDTFAPIPRMRREVICLGLNYLDHIEQNARATGASATPPTVPMFFAKPVTAVIGPNASIEWDPTVTQRLDYEIELAIVIGRRGKNIPKEKAWDHVFGYTLVNDISARDVQLRVSQFYQGKGFDTYCPIGPCIVSKDEIATPHNLQLTLRVNGETRQQTSTASMIFKIPDIVAQLSVGMMLEPGDIVTTATPGGCAYVESAPRFLKDGDIVECEAEGIGILRNPVVKIQRRYIR